MQRKSSCQLSPEGRFVIEFEGTEPAFVGGYEAFLERGAYLWHRCDGQLCRSDDQFDAGCGWPAFDGDIRRRGSPDARPGPQARRDPVRHLWWPSFRPSDAEGEPFHMRGPGKP
ncbi:MAG: peptide-methionine (R)-S-oxide reductase [Chloroflexi bacterium]|nr:peptide-methionine (R)-S-oxide reductase [Chloroflexota bacterium]